MTDNEYRERLAHDAARWAREGIITPEQEHDILARAGAGLPRAVGALRMGWLVTAVSIIGALVLAAGVVLFFAANWQDMPDLARTLLVFAGIAAAYAIAYALMFRYDMQRIGSAFLLLGALLYEAGIFLVAQIYNMPVDSAALWFLAAAGIAPLAYFFESRIVLLVAIANAVAWVTVEMLTRYPDPPEAEASLVVIGVFGIALYAVGRLHALRPALERFADVYVFAGALVLLALVYVFTFDEVWQEVIDSGAKSNAAPAVVYFAVVAAGLLVLAQLVLGRARARDLDLELDAGGQIALLAIAAVVATWPAWSGYALVFNAVYFAVAASLVARGYLRGDERYINFGLAAVGIGLLTRYVDVFWSLLAGSAFFMIGGVLLLALAWGIERFRRNLIAGMAVLPPTADTPEGPAASGGAEVPA